MTGGGRPGRTTVLVGLLLALLLAAAYAVTSFSTVEPRRPEPTPLPTAPGLPSVPGSTPPPATPGPGVGYPVRQVGALRDQSAIVNGRGNADLRYRRAPRNGTRLHFICTGCDADTWLVEQPRGSPVGGGPLTDPSDATWAVDTVRPGRTTDLLVKAPAGAAWTVTLTPFDAVPVQEQTFDALGDDVVAVRARTGLQISCGGALVLRTLARGAGAKEYAVVEVRQQDQPGRWPVAAPTGTDLTIVMVSCPGRWTLTVP